MLIRIETSTLLQIFCELLLYSQVIVESMRVADDTYWKNSISVNGLKYSPEGIHVGGLGEG